MVPIRGERPIISSESVAQRPDHALACGVAWRGVACGVAWPVACVVACGMAWPVAWHASCAGLWPVSWPASSVVRWPVSPVACGMRWPIMPITSRAKTLSDVGMRAKKNPPLVS